MRNSEEIERVKRENFKFTQYERSPSRGDGETTILDNSIEFSTKNSSDINAYQIGR